MEISLPSTPAAAWLILLAFVGLVLQAVIQRPDWSARLKRGITLGVAAVLGTVYAVIFGAISGFPPGVVATLSSWLANIAAILVCGQAVYGYLKPILNKLESATDSA